MRNGLDPSVGYGQQSLRMSNACASGESFNQTYSPQELVQVGEGRVNKVFIAEFSFMSKTAAHQPGLFLSVSPDSHEGSRMSWVGLEDTPAGIRVSAADTPKLDGKFVRYPDLALLDRARPHTIRFRIKVNRGPDNDVVRIAIDGVPVGCFTTWENSYRTAPDINSLQFRSSVPGPPDLAGGGYLFDNVSITPSNGPGPKACLGGGGGTPPGIDKQTQTRFARPGDLVTYRLSVRNRGDAPVRELRACDRAPRALRFVGARPRLRPAAGGRLCRTIRLLRPGQRKTFRATFRLRTNVTADTVTNGGSVDIPSGSAPSPSPPDTAVIAKPRRRVLGTDSATIGIRRAGACGAAVNPRAHVAC